MLKFNIIDPSWFEAYAAACGNNKDKLLKYFEKHVTSKCGNVNRSINQSINQSTAETASVRRADLLCQRPTA